MIMKTRMIAASLLSLGLLTSVAFAENSGNSFCAPGQSYDRENLVCVGSTGQPVTDNAALAVSGASKQVSPGNVGDFIDETATESRERSSN
jgi:hypothetical protein